MEVLAEFEKEHQRQAHIIKINQTKEYEELEISRTAEHVRAYIKVQDGCNQFCTYCIIPYARGRVRSREKENILNEVHKLAKAGYKEVVLTGIHLSSYGVDFPKDKKETLLSLIQAVNEVEGIQRIRLGSLEPVSYTHLHRGVVQLEALEKALRPDTILVSTMYVNNEVGAVMPVEEIAKLVHEKSPKALYHVDAIQAFGKYRIYPKKAGIDMLSVSSHKIHGPKGVGFLYINEKARIQPQILGGGQQAGMRSGTDLSLIHICTWCFYPGW